MNSLLFLLLAQFSITGLIILVVKILVVAFVVWLLLWAIAQFPAGAAPIAVLIQILRVVIVVIGALIILLMLLGFIGIAM
jgi:hypothetical protein